MDTGSNPRTARDALTIDLLGDVGKVHDIIKALPVEISKAFDTTRRQMHDCQAVLSEKLAELPGAADRELKRAGDAAINQLSHDVAQIAQQIAGNAAAATAANAKVEAARWQGGMLIVGLLVGSVGSYLFAIGTNALNMNKAREKVAAAELRAESAETEAKRRADSTISAMSARNSWAVTGAGLHAHALAQAGDLLKISSCTGEGWVRKRDEASGAVWCYIPQKQGIFSRTELVPQFRVPDYKND